MKIKLDEGAKLHTRQHKWDAGLDLYAMEEGYIRCNQSHTFDTGVHVQIPEGCVGFIKSRSGLMVLGMTTRQLFIWLPLCGMRVLNHHPGRLSAIAYVDTRETRSTQRRRG